MLVASPRYGDPWMADTAHASLEEGQKVAERYLLLRRLASGGMGSVWVARHEQLEVEVAIKFMDSRLAASDVLRRRFAREAKAAAMLETRHVVRVLDYGVDGELPFIVMELLRGEDLRARLRRVGRTSLPEAARLLQQVARGLGRAHEAGIIHRDLKPANVFLARSDAEEVVKLLDFGVAKQLAEDDANATQTGVLVGSPNYMSPEQARGHSTADHRSDLWSLGVVLFRCLTGRLPFQGANSADVLVKICTDPVPRASSLAPELPPAIDAFFDRALQRDPDARFGSLIELVHAFEQAVGLDASFSLNSMSEPSVLSGPILRESLAHPPPEEATEVMAAPVDTLTGTDSTSVMRRRRPWWPWLAAVLSLAAGAALAMVWAAAPADPSQVSRPGEEDPRAAGNTGTKSVLSEGAADPVVDAVPTSPTTSQPPQPDDEREGNAGAGGESSPPSSASSTKRPPPGASPPRPRAHPKRPPRGQTYKKPAWGF